ncbi:MAG: 2-oxoacid:acceptor oxidoreductase family protein [bacterium]
MIRAEIRFAGSGGQGLILASKIVSEAAGLYEGFNVVQTQIYGAAARGELSKADVIIDDGNIYTLEVSSADILLCLSQEAYDRYHTELKEEGIIILDDFYVKNYDKLNSRYLTFPISRTAKEIAGSEIATNIVGVGLITELGGYFSRESAEKAVTKRVPKGFLDINIKALHAGFDMANKKNIRLCRPR